MNSPLPDSSALEAGIIEDSKPSRLSRVQDNVRNLLRSSIVGSVVSSPRVPPERSPVETRFFHATWPRAVPEVLPSPTESVSSATSVESTSSASSTTSQNSTDLLLPPVSYSQAIQHMAHQSALFDTRAIAALNHPDLSDATLAAEIRNDVRRRQRRAWKRSKRHELRTRVTSSQVVICVIIGLALAGVLSTYIALAITSTQAPPVFHILFILGILSILIAFVHTLARLVFLPTPTRRRRHKSRHRAQNSDLETGRPEHTYLTRDQFLPSEPIPIVLEDDEVPLDVHEAQPSSAVHQPPEVWNAGGGKGVTQPPPAYGRWRGSVRVNPELIHWQAVRSPNGSPTVPSPTYQESQNTGDSTAAPPSYKTRDSPGRSQQQQHLEMIEGRGIGLAQ